MNRDAETVLMIKNFKIAHPGCDYIRYPEINLEKGKCISISGPTGCGKTSLLNALFKPSFKGEVDYEEAKILGKDIYSFRSDIFKSVSYMPQYSQDGLNPMLTIHDQIKLVAESNGLSLKDINFSQLLSKLNLKEFVLRQHRHQMSGGMKQRVVLLMSVLKQPAILALDEPSSAIDCLTLELILEFLIDVKRSGIAILLVSHDTSFTNYLSDVSIRLEGI